MAETITKPMLFNGNVAAVDLNSTGTNVVAVTFPKWVRLATGYGEDNAGAAAAWQFAYTGSDNTGQASDAYEVPAGAAYPIRFARDRDAPSAAPVLYISGENNGKVRFHLEGGE